MSIDTQTARTCLGDDIATIVRQEAERLRSLADPSGTTHTHTALLVNIDSARDRCVAIAAAEAALRHADLPDRPGNLLDARTFAELSAAVQVLDTVRITIATVLGGNAAALVQDARSAAIKRMEALTANR